MGPPRGGPGRRVAGRGLVTEDELIAGLMDAMALSGWVYWHVRRSDRALWMGVRGWPDITALSPRLNGPLLLIEAKSPKGVITPDQARWMALLHRSGHTTALVRPAGYDRALGLILAGDSSQASWEWAFRL